MGKYEQLFKRLKPQSKDAKDDHADLLLALNTGSSEAEWKKEYEEFIKEYPKSVPAKKKITKPKAKKKPPVRTKKPKSDLQKIKSAKSRSDNKKAEDKKKKEKAEKEKAEKIKIEKEQKEIENKLKDSYKKFHSTDPLKKMEFTIAKSNTMKLSDKRKKKKKSTKAKRYGHEMQKEHDTALARKQIANPARVELERNKTGNSLFLKAADDIDNATLVIASDIDDHLMQKNQTESLIIAKGFKALAFAAVAHEANLTEKYKERPKALKALEDLDFVKVERDGKKVIEVELNPKLKDQAKPIRRKILEVSRAMKFARGGKIKKYGKGGDLDVDPAIYVADLAAYNEGKLIGEWVNLTQFSSGEEVVEHIQELVEKWSKEQGVEREEWAIHDYEGFPSRMYSEYMGRAEDFQEIFDFIEAIENTGLPQDVVESWVDYAGEDQIDRIQDAYFGVYDDKSDFAYQLIEDTGGIGEMGGQASYYAYVSETDKRIIAGEEADFRIEDYKYEGPERLLEEAGMDFDEYEEADEERQEEMLSEAEDTIMDEIYDEWYKGLDDPVHFLVHEQGIYSESDLGNVSFIQFDYEKYGEELGYDFTYIDGEDGMLYVFSSNYNKGGKVKKKEIRTASDVDKLSDEEVLEISNSFFQIDLEDADMYPLTDAKLARSELKKELKQGLEPIPYSKGGKVDHDKKIHDLEDQKLAYKYIDEMSKKEVDDLYHKIEAGQVLASDIDEDEIYNLSTKQKREFLKTWYSEQFKKGGKIKK